MCKVNKIKKYLVEVKNSSPLRVGNGDDEGIGILLQDKHAVINGTTLAGIFQEFVSDGDIKNLIFPPQSNRDISKVYFYDSLSEEEIEDEAFICRTHIRINEKLGSAEEKHLFNEYHISEGKRFCFRFDVMGLELEEDQYCGICEYVEEFICRLAKGQVSIGSKATFGFGKFELCEDDKYYAKEFDLSKEEDLNKYLDINISEKKYLEPQDINLHNVLGCEIIFKGYCEDGFIINDDYKNENKKQVGVTHTEVINGDEYVVIPSSTIKGVVRAYSSKIYRTLDKDISELDDIFGCNGDSLKEKKKGKITFNDCKIKKNQGNILKECSRIMVDRFTGGNINVFHNEVVVVPKKDVVEPLEFRISLKDYDEKALALILLTLRDMGLGYVTIGSGSSVGYGRLTGKSISLITKDEKNFSIDFDGEVLKGNVEEANRIIESLLNGGV